MMNICIDVRPALSGATGVGVYILNLLEGLSRVDQENQYHLFSSSWKQRFPLKNWAQNFDVHDRRIPVRLLNFTWHRLSFPSIEFLTGSPIDIAHSPTPLMLPAKRARRIITICDLYFYLHPEDTIREIKSDYSALVKNHCLESDAIIAISDHTKNELIQHLQVPSSKVHTIRLAVDPFFYHRLSEAERFSIIKELGISQPYFLFVGTQEPRKNLEVLLRAYSMHSFESKLVVAGAEGWGMDRWKQLVGENVIQTGYVSKQQLRALYQCALALILPSWEEGFGLPLLEAMASDIPVIASRIDVFQEVAGPAFLAFDPAEPEELMECMKKIFSDSDLRSLLVKEGQERVKKYSWEHTAQRTLDLYTHI